METRTHALGQAQEIIMPLEEFKLFPQLPSELRDKIWEFATPGPRIVTVRARESFTETVTTEREGTDIIVIVRKIRFNIAFSCNMKALGMLRACRESRQVIVERLPIRLPSRISTQEIRLSLHDVLSIRNIRSFLTDLQAANNYGLEIPTAIFQIPALVIFSKINGATDLNDFIRIFGSYNIFPLPISVLKPFRTVVFCPEDRRQSTYDDTDCFRLYTEFRYNLIDTGAVCHV
ncbi:hypothetical protein NA56DRAFT_666655 [Hyaloscypha hepaticicola]|uniref:2EXR domain-containing protein n=1 Tax=Hyaloscypha hepaticicola TaxID=2082293 RepID=A0A2J6PDW5_9HELO|nr:hypothetical protein NA56DRAFT_666655 [Hyaloscypha hepaticicola]